MRHYWKILVYLFKQNFIRDLQFRSDFWLSVLTQLSWFGMQVLLFRLFYNQTAAINGWDFYQAIVLLGVFTLLEMVLFTFFMHNLSRMPYYISDGGLDFLLLKPVDAQFFVSFRYLSTNSIFQILPALLLLFIGLRELGVSPSGGQILLFALAALSSLVILYSLWFITVISLFWINKVFEIHELFLSLFHFVKYPANVYQGAVRQFFSFVFPILFTITVPAQIVLNRLENIRTLLALPFIAVVTLLAARLIWRAGLRRYASASS